ncbi:MAG: hypothetical protein ACHQF0_05565 [Chitinophagales bacterium]
MKYVKLLSAILLSSCLWVACSGNSSASAAKDTASGNSAASGTSSSGNASFSATIDGTAVSGNMIDELQLQNTAFIYPAVDKSPQRALFFLYSNKKGDDFYYFRFSFPDKEGVYKFTHETDEDCNCYLMLDYNLKSTEYYPRYDEDSVTVTIDKITSTRISGTFSGRLRLSDDTRSKPYKNNVIINDGKFDIPFSTGNVRPE